jgi:hypothetical protein
MPGRRISWTEELVFCTTSSNRDVHDRYEYGELRLDRLTQVCRMKFLALVIFQRPSREHELLRQRLYDTYCAFFALVSVALSAMQVITGVDSVSAAVTVMWCRFAVETLITLAGSCAALLLLCIGFYVWS